MILEEIWLAVWVSSLSTLGNHIDKENNVLFPIVIPESYDFGDVSQKARKVFTYFELKNEGESDLIIDRLETSCGCTFAAVVFQGQESPYFTMPGHGYENPDWGGVTIPAGGTA